MTLTECFIKTCQEFSGGESLRIKTSNGWDVYSYENILIYSLRVAGWLKERGIEKNDKISIVLDNGPDWVITYFGILLVGGVVVPLDPQSSIKDIEVFIKDSGSKFVVIENRISEEFSKKIQTFVNIILKEGSKEKDQADCLKEILSKHEPLSIDSCVKSEPKDTASIIYTSGTTSYPKGVELLHQNIFSNFNSVNKLKLVTSEDVFISILPLFHAYSFMGTLILPLFIGAKIVYPNTLKSIELLESMRETSVSIMIGIPELFYNLHRSISNKLKEVKFTKRVVLKFLTSFGAGFREVSKINILKKIYKQVHETFGGNLRLMVSGGARLDPKIAKDFFRFGFTILEGYGLTETSPIVSLNPLGKQIPGSVGKVIPDVDVKILNPDNNGIGEIIINGPNVMKGYFRKQEDTTKVIKDGWFYSGDQGYLDKKGYLYISGRLKEIIVLGSGKNIFPSEIESYYSRTKFIKEMAIFLPKDVSNNLKAIIVPDFEAFKKSGEINIEEKIRWDIENISKELPSYKRVHGFVFSKEELPKTRLGKIKRYKLEDIYNRIISDSYIAKDLPQEDENKDFVLSPVGEKTIQFLETEIKLERPVRFTDHFEIDLGVDSLSRVELIAGLEQIFKIKLTDLETAQVGIVSELINLIQDKIAVNDFDKNVKSPVKISWRNILFDKSDPSIFEGIEFNQSKFKKTIGRLLQGFIFIIFKIFFRIKISGAENLPDRGPYIFCPNHSSYLDSFAVISALPKKIVLQTYFIGTKDIFNHPTIKWSHKFARLIPIDSASELTKAMKVSSYVINHNKILCIFPEGQRSIDNSVKKFKKGIGILAKELGVHVVPVAIKGSHEAWPRVVKFPKMHPICVKFGKLYSFEELAVNNIEGEVDEYQKIADMLKEKVVNLMKEIN